MRNTVLHKLIRAYLETQTLIEGYGVCLGFQIEMLGTEHPLGIIHYTPHQIGSITLASLVLRHDDAPYLSYFLSFFMKNLAQATIFPSSAIHECMAFLSMPSRS